MDFIRNFPMFSVVLSLFSGVLCTLLPGKKARIYTIAYECVLIAMAAAVLWFTVHTGASFTYVMGEFPAPWGNELRAGVLLYWPANAMWIRISTRARSISITRS